MSVIRRSPAHQVSVALLLAFALLARMLVPTGWMPVFDGHTLRLEMCGGTVAQPQAIHVMPGMEHGKQDGHGKHGAKELPCPYAALSFAATAADVLTPAAPPPAYPEPLAPRETSVAVGRGLAAPPPPATGPPTLA